MFKKACLSIIVATSFLSFSAYAACTDPAGAEGEQVFNVNYAVMQFCDGTHWVRMDGAGASHWVQDTGYLYRERGAVGIGTNTVPAGIDLAVTGKAKVDSIEILKQEDTQTNYVTDLSRLPVVDNATRNSLAPREGMVILNSDTQAIQFYNGSEWRAVGGTQNTYIGSGGDLYSLYSFDTHRFTSCGASGRDGPFISDCRTAYSTSWDENDDYFTMHTQGYQLWRVPVTGRYYIRAAAARGGYGFNGTSYSGKGRIVEGVIELSANDQLIIVVGQMGQDRETQSAHGGGGGGGTFVAKGDNQTTAEILMVAGGGAGGNAYGTYGWIARYGGDGNGYSTNYGDVIRDWGNYRGSGASLSLEGIDHNNNAYHRAKPFRQNARGGQKSDCYTTYGGFGGGGTPHCHNGAGGGGYHGGAAGHDHRYSGEGGGSFINAAFTDQNDNFGLNNGHGYVEVTLLP